MSVNYFLLEAHWLVNGTVRQQKLNYKSNLYMTRPIQYVADLTDFLLRHSSQDGVKLEVFSAGQQVVDGIKLRTVAHVLMHLINLCGYTGESIRV